MNKKRKEKGMNKMKSKPLYGSHADKLIVDEVDETLINLLTHQLTHLLTHSPNHLPTKEPILLIIVKCLILNKVLKRLNFEIRCFNKYHSFSG